MGDSEPAGLTIVAFSSSERVAAFREAMLKAGHPATLISGVRWLEDGHGGHASPLVLFFSADHLDPCDQSKVFARTRGAAACAVSDPVLAPYLARRRTDPRLWRWPEDEAALIEWLRIEASRTPARSVPLAHEFATFKALSLVGRSASFRRVLEQVQECAASSSPVLIRGAPGTGKRLTARAIHYLGLRHAGPFVPLDCQRLSHRMIKAELRGLCAGKETSEPASGVVGLAHGGTLFFDGVDCLGGRSRALLLRFVQSQQYRPFGGTRSNRPDVRIIAAARDDAPRTSAEPRPLRPLRRDLRCRPAFHDVRLPPLADREDDIPVLAQHFLRGAAGADGVRAKSFSAATLALLRRRPWPGNVRELKEFVARAAEQAEATVIDLRDIAHSSGQAA